MAKGLLINFPGYPASLREFYLDNGLANLASALISGGHEARVLDFANPDIIRWFFPHQYKEEIRLIAESIKASNINKEPISDSIIQRFHSMDDRINEYQRAKLYEFAESEILPLIETFKPGFIGFKLWIGEGFQSSSDLAKIIRERYPEIKIIAGGPQIDWFDKKIYTYGFGDYYDALAIGEGEETIQEYADFCDGKIPIERVSNLIIQKDSKIITTYTKRIEDLSSLSDPIYSHPVYDPIGQNKKIRIMMIDESRGCPNSCSFCLHPYKSGDVWRTRNEVKIVDQIERMIQKYQTNIFRFAGSNPPPDLKKKIAKEIIKRRLKVKYAAFGHVKGTNKEDYELLRQSGCVALFFGIESGSEKILKESMNKNTTPEQIERAMNFCSETGIKCVASVIVPAPFDTPETIQETLDMLLRIKPYSVIVNSPGALPHTDWYINKKKYGFDIGESGEFMIKFMTYTIKNFYPQELWRELPEYSLNNKTAKEILSISASFTNKLQKAGISTKITDDLSLLIEALNVNGEEMMNNTRELLMSGNYEALMDMILNINNSIQKGLKDE